MINYVHMYTVYCILYAGHAKGRVSLRHRSQCAQCRTGTAGELGEGPCVPRHRRAAGAG